MYLLNPYILKSSTLKESLISCWEFDETSGTTADDSHGSNNITNSGFTVNQTGKIDKCYNGVYASHYLTTGNVVISQLPLSISTWIKVENSNSTTFWITTNSGTPEYRGVTLIFKQNYLEYGIGDGLGSGSTNRKSYYYNTTLNLYNWYNIILTIDSSYSSFKMYLNGVDLGSPSGSSGAATSLSLSGGSFKVQSNSTDNYWIDQTVVWSKVLNTTEISQLYNSGNGLAYINW